MNLHELWENTYEILGIIGTVMGVFGLPSVAVLYNRALKKQIEFSPALAYAYTYFNNFITPLHDRFVSGEQLTVDGFAIQRILSSMEPIIAEHVGVPRTQKSSTRSKVETREIDHFCKHIRRLIKQNGYQQRVKVFNCEVHDLTAEVDDLETPSTAHWYARVWQRMTPWLRRDEP